MKKRTMHSSKLFEILEKILPSSCRLPQRIEKQPSSPRKEACLAPAYQKMNRACPAPTPYHKI